MLMEYFVHDAMAQSLAVIAIVAVWVSALVSRRIDRSEKHTIIEKELDLQIERSKHDRTQIEFAGARKSAETTKSK